MKKLLMAVALFGAVTQAQAVGVGVRAGTTGVGADIAFGVIPTLSARVGYSALNVDHTVDKTNISYDGKLKLSNLSALLDWSPLPGPFRVTGGLVAASNKIGLTGKPKSGTYTLNNNTYSSTQISSIDGEVKGKNTVAPYLGIGYGIVAGAGVNFYADLGVMMQGGTSATVNASCGSTASASTCASIQNDARAEQQKLQDDVKGFKVWPVLNLGVTIGF